MPDRGRLAVGQRRRWQGTTRRGHGDERSKDARGSSSSAHRRDWGAASASASPQRGEQRRADGAPARQDPGSCERGGQRRRSPSSATPSIRRRARRRSTRPPSRWAGSTRSSTPPPSARSSGCPTRRPSSGCRRSPPTSSAPATSARRRCRTSSKSVGNVIYMSTTGASYTAPWGGLSVYQVSKAALNRLAEHWRVEQPGHQLHGRDDRRVRRRAGRRPVAFQRRLGHGADGRVRRRLVRPQPAQRIVHRRRAPHRPAPWAGHRGPVDPGAVDGDHPAPADPRRRHRRARPTSARWRSSSTDPARFARVGEPTPLDAVDGSGRTRGAVRRRRVGG